MKKWLPFILLLSAALLAGLWLVLQPGENPYKPETNRPEKIYREVCLQCHGDLGQGSGLLYPAFEADLDTMQIKEAIVKGGFLMPSFTGIRGDTLDRLVYYVDQLKPVN